jgi:aspartate kinase
MSTLTNGFQHHSDRIAHTEEKHLPGGWSVLKFGGTSVGKFAENVAGIVQYAPLLRHRPKFGSDVEIY